MTAAHYFEFSRDFVDGERICGSCRLSYATGEHIEITTLKPFTNYICPSGGGTGHSSIYTGAHRPELRNLREHICACGRELVEEDHEKWMLQFEVERDGVWAPVEVVQSRHATEQQYAGLMDLIEEGEPIRNVKRTQLVAA